MRKENIVDCVFSAMEGGLGIQQSFLAQGIGEALYGRRGADFMFSQKIAGGNLSDCTLFGNSDEKPPLFFG